MCNLEFITCFVVSWSERMCLFETGCQMVSGIIMKLCLYVFWENRLHVLIAAGGTQDCYIFVLSFR